MNLKDLATKPQLVKMTLDDEDIISQYGEPLDFWVYDKQPIDQFLKMASSAKDDIGALGLTVKGLVLDEQGNEIIQDGTALPGSVLMKVLNKVVDSLGK